MHHSIVAQDKDTVILDMDILLEEAVIRSELDVETFIKMIKEDTTYYKAFRSLHLVTYNATNDIKVYDKSFKNVVASLQSETKQIYRNNCRTMKVLDEEVAGKFYDKRGNYNYYTAEMYAELLFTKGEICGEDNIVYQKIENEIATAKGSLAKNKVKLKQMMFNPGSKIKGVPFMGDAAAIFEPHIAKMYQFKITSDTKNGESCYLFEAIPKPEYKSKIVYNVFRTWFRYSDLSIIARDYSLSYSAGVYDFDVWIQTRLKQQGEYLVPYYLHYNGSWRAISKGRENVKFTAVFDFL